MKFKDVPQLIQKGNYEINIGLKYLENTLEEFKKDYGLELNPDFQRGHVWTEKQQIAFVEFFLQGGRTSRVIYFNCPYFEEGRKNLPMVCVDGLQRLTSLRRFLNNEIKVFGYYLNDYEDKDIFLRGQNSLKFNINNLKTKKEVLEWYLQFNAGGTPHTDEEIQRVRKMLQDIK